MTFDHILLARTSSVSTITINRPDVLNALSAQSLEELSHAIDHIERDGLTRALVLTGNGRAFCAGADLGAVRQIGSQRDMGAVLEAGFNPLVEKLRNLSVPLVTAINGGAIGGGCGFALMGDVVIASKSAYFLLPFANIGLVPDVGLTWTLPRAVGRTRAMAMMMLGEKIESDQALSWGMIYRLVPDDKLGATAHAIATRLAQGPTLAYRLMRQAVYDGQQSDLSDALSAERRYQRQAGLTEDHIEGITAFLEKRYPQFRGS